MSARKKSRKISFQKIFCFVSFIFILTCCFWYGGRFVYFYLDSKKVESDGKVSFAQSLRVANHSEKTFRKDGDIYYFYQDSSSNYLRYSNLLWRIIRINDDDSITLISDESVTRIAYGDDVEYKDSSVMKWMNVGTDSTSSGILEKQINKVSDYLVKTSVCTDVVSDVEKISCDKVNNDYYFGLLSVDDYIKTGGNKSFINNGVTTYLANKNDEEQIWYIDNEGKLNQSLGDDFLSVRPVITLSANVQIKSGKGSLNEPYVIEDETNYFASYVKLDNDIWRVYDSSGDNIKLMLTDYVKDSNDTKYSSIYSNSTYRHNDTVSNSLAYYLNHTYYNKLSYKGSILNGYYNNGYYGEETEYGLKELYLNQIDTHVAVPSIGDVIFDSKLSNFFTSTGIYKNSTSVYVIKEDEVITKKVTNEANVVPCITVKKDILKKGTGTKEDPYMIG